MSLALVSGRKVFKTFQGSGLFLIISRKQSTPDLVSFFPETKVLDKYQF